MISVLKEVEKEWCANDMCREDGAVLLFVVDFPEYRNRSSEIIS